MRGYDGNVTATCQPTFTHPDALSLPIVPRPTTAIIAVSTRKCWDELITLIINRVLIANSYRFCHYLDVDGSFVFDCFPRVGPAFPVIFFPFFFLFFICLSSPLFEKFGRVRRGFLNRAILNFKQCGFLCKFS